MFNTSIARRPHPRSLRAILIALFGLLVLSFVFSFNADSARAATEPCVADSETGCFNGTIKDVGAGVVITVEGNGQEVEAETNAEGKWSASVKAAGVYTITLDPDTLPDGLTVLGEASQERDVTLGFSKGVIFKVGEPGTDMGDGATATGVSFDRFAQQFVSGIRLGLLLALASIGLSLIYGTTGLSSFSHSEQVTMGGLLGFTFANVLGLDIFLTAVIVVAITAATGYVQDALIWKPLRKKGLSLTQMMIVTIGLALALQYLFQLFYGASTVRIISANPETFQIGPVTLTFQSLMAMGVSIVVLVLVGLFLLKTRVGRATRAVSDNPALAAASGIDVDRIIRLVWVIATGLAGLSGLMLGLVLNGINWQTGLQLLLLMFAAVTLGGLGTAFGALVGSIIVGLSVELANLVLPGDFKYATALVLLIIILLVRPQGIFGRKERIG